MKAQQQKALCAFLGGKNVLVALTTGYGKRSSAIWLLHMGIWLDSRPLCGG